VLLVGIVLFVALEEMFRGTLGFVEIRSGRNSGAALLIIAGL
jgi:hypothetical protein